MRRVLAIILLGFISNITLGQSREIEVNFTPSCWSEEGDWRSEKHLVERGTAEFVGITAYSEEIIEGNFLWYRILVENKWQSWVLMKEFTEMETEGRQTFEGPPIYQNFDSIQFKSNSRREEKVVFRLFVPTQKKNESLNDSNELVQPCSLPIYCSRICWGQGNCPKDSAPVLSVPTHLIVHHSAGFNSSTDFSQVVAYYWDFHVNTNGWSDIGYNWLIDPNGEIYEGRGHNTLGAHFSCMNSNTLGICMIGNYENTAPTDTSMGSLRDLLAFEASSNNISPTNISFHQSSQLYLYNISGHRDGNVAHSLGSCPKGTVCPGDSLYALLPALRNEIAAKACMQGVNLAEFKKVDVKIYPNPVFDKLFISSNEKLGKVFIYNSKGELIYHKEVEEEKVNIDCSGLTPGGYWLKIEADQSLSKKFIIAP